MLPVRVVLVFVIVVANIGVTSSLQCSCVSYTNTRLFTRAEREEEKISVNKILVGEALLSVETCKSNHATCDPSTIQGPPGWQPYCMLYNGPSSAIGGRTVWWRDCVLLNTTAIPVKLLKAKFVG